MRTPFARLGVVVVAAVLGGAAPAPIHVNGSRLRDLLVGLAEFGKNPEGGVTCGCLLVAADRA